MLRMFRPYNFTWIAGCFSVTMAPRYEMCVGMEKGHKTTKNVQKVEFFNFVKCVQPVLRIHLILMRIRILNPHWKKWIRIQVIYSRFTEFFLSKKIFKCFIFFAYFYPKTWWTIQKWGNFIISFFKSSESWV